jgi:Xaa-Pro dipeptidase
MAAAGFLDRQRAAREMAASGLDALLLTRPESVRYAAGAFPGVASLWRQAAAALLLVPADPSKPLAAVVGDLERESFARTSSLDQVATHPIWVETAELGEASEGDVAAAITAAAQRPPGFTRPATYDPAQALRALAPALQSGGLDRGHVGLEMDFVSVAEFPLFQAAFPAVRWHDASRLVERLRMVKHPGEIELLRKAAALTSAGLGEVLAALRPGLDAAAMRTLFAEALDREAAARGVTEAVTHWAYIAVGPDGFAPGDSAEPGDVIKIDVGAVVAGYSADMARTAVIGRASPAQRRLYDAVHRSFDAALELLRPGVPLGALHAAATQAMHASGFTSYERGHFGHSLGATLFNEEWPFVSAGSGVELEPGMIMVLEAPYYVRGLGGFILEDQFLVTEHGAEVLSPLPRPLFETPHFEARP